MYSYCLWSIMSFSSGRSGYYYYRIIYIFSHCHPFFGRVSSPSLNHTHIYIYTWILHYDRPIIMDITGNLSAFLIWPVPYSSSSVGALSNHTVRLVRRKSFPKPTRTGTERNRAWEYRQFWFFLEPSFFFYGYWKPTKRKTYKHKHTRTIHRYNWDFWIDIHGIIGLKSTKHASETPTFLVNEIRAVQLYFIGRLPGWNGGGEADQEIIFA